MKEKKKSIQTWNWNCSRQRGLIRPRWRQHYQNLDCKTPSEHAKEGFNRLSCRGRQPVQGGASYTPIDSLFTLLRPQAAKRCHPTFCRCIKASVPQTQGRIKPLAKIRGVTATCPFRLSNGIFHFEGGSGNMGEANELNGSLFFWKSFMVIAADRTLWSDAASGRTGNHLRAD